jgi:uncharacterized membrane protein YvbJ
MQCRSCGAEIADKALICYKCGTATTEAKYQPAQLRQNATRSRLVPTVIAMAILVAAVLYLERASGGASQQWVTYIAVGAAVIIIGIRAYARRR